MKKPVTQFSSPGRLTLLATLIAALSAPAFAAPGQLVISQVYGGSTGSAYRNDYVEIFNPGSTAVTANGWSLQYAAATGSSWGKLALPSSFTVEPGRYELIQLAAGTASAPALPTPLLASGGLNMAGASGKVALVNDNVALTGTSPAGPSIVDLVGYGAANFYEGSGPTALTSTSTAAFRANGGCTDTDQNASDFTVGAPAPRTSASAANVCGGGQTDQPIVLSCPNLTFKAGAGGMVGLSGTDPDSIVNGASLVGAPVGISLLNFVAAGAAGGSASVTLQASGALAAGAYPVDVNFTNNTSQNKTCTVTVSVSGEASIPVIQGAGATSPFNNIVMTTQGVVTHKVSNGYFLQDVGGDGDPATSDAIFVFSSPAAVNVADLVKITGTVTEFKPTGAPRTYTEMKDVVATDLISAGNSIAPTNVVFDATFDAPAHEAMLLSFSNPLTVNGNAYLGDRGELTLSNGRRETATNRFRPKTPEAIALAAANLKNQIILDDSLFTTPATVPYLAADGTVRAGDTVTGLTGVLDYGSGGDGAGFKVHPVVAPTFSRTNPRLEAPVIATGNVKVASANVLNFFTTFTNGGDAFGATGQGCVIGGGAPKASECRGADNMAEFVRQRDKIVNELKAIDADVIGLMEIQNNGDIAVDYLVKQLNAAVGFETYAYVPKPAAVGTDAIRVAMIYKPAKLALVGGALSDGDAVNNRPPMAQTFKAPNGATFSVIVNHLKSKGSCGSGANADQNDGQGCNNATRVLQANRLISYFIPQVVSASGDPDVLIIGDMNAHGFEDPIYALNQAGFVNELERFVRPTEIPYSYQFDAEAGYLDHALSSASLSPQVAGAVEWHTNADEPVVIDYNLDGKNTAAQALYKNDAFRSSDHDPVVIALNLNATFGDATASFTIQRSGFVLNRLTGKYTGSVTLTNKSASAINGPVHLQFDGLSAGVTLDNKTGTRNGAPYLTLANASIAPGASINVPVTFSNPSKVGIGFTNTVYSGNF